MGATRPGFERACVVLIGFQPRVAKLFGECFGLDRFYSFHESGRNGQNPERRLGNFWQLAQRPDLVIILLSHPHTVPQSKLEVRKLQIRDFRKIKAPFLGVIRVSVSRIFIAAPGFLQPHHVQPEGLGFCLVESLEKS